MACRTSLHLHSIPLYWPADTLGRLTTPYPGAAWLVKSYGGFAGDSGPVPLPYGDTQQCLLFTDCLLYIERRVQIARPRPILRSRARARVQSIQPPVVLP